MMPTVNKKKRDRIVALEAEVERLRGEAEMHADMTVQEVARLQGKLEETSRGYINARQQITRLRATIEERGFALTEARAEVERLRRIEEENKRLKRANELLGVDLVFFRAEMNRLRQANKPVPAGIVGVKLDEYQALRKVLRSARSWRIHSTAKTEQSLLRAINECDGQI
jgi:predicted transcriptional regulator